MEKGRLARLAVAALLALAALWPVVALGEGVATVLISYVDTAGLPEVGVYVSVLDGSGQPIAGLNRSNFQVTEDGVAQDVVDVAQATEAVTVALALDTSGSMASGPAGSQPIDYARKAAEAFVRALEKNSPSAAAPQDQLAVVSFNDTPTVRSGLSRDHNAAVNAIRGLRAEQKWTALYDAAYEAVKQASASQQGRRAVLLFTDGRDEGSGGRPGSSMTFNDVADLARRSNVAIYTVGLGTEANSQELARLANLTGGMSFKETDPAKLTAVFDRIASQLKMQYRLRVSTSSAATDHTIQVRVRRDSAEATDLRVVHYPAVPPVVQLVAPTKDAKLRGEVEIVPGFSAYLQRPIVKVEYWLGSQLVGTSAAPPYTFRWDTSSVRPGTYDLEVRAYDLGSQMGKDRVSVVVLPPLTPTAIAPATSEARPTATDVSASSAGRAAQDGIPWQVVVPALLALGALGLIGVAVLSRRALPAPAAATPGSDALPTAQVPGVVESAPKTAPIPEANLATLTIVRGPTQIGQVFYIGETTLIGRDPSCDVIIADPTNAVSRQHVRISVVGGDFVVYDLGSVNGTRVGGVLARRDQGLILTEDAELLIANRYVLRLGHLAPVEPPEDEEPEWLEKLAAEVVSSEQNGAGARVAGGAEAANHTRSEALRQLEEVVASLEIAGLDGEETEDETEILPVEAKADEAKADEAPGHQEVAASPVAEVPVAPAPAAEAPGEEAPSAEVESQDRTEEVAAGVPAAEQDETRVEEQAPSGQSGVPYRKVFPKGLTHRPSGRRLPAPEDVEPQR